MTNFLTIENAASTQVAKSDIQDNIYILIYTQRNG